MSRQTIIVSASPEVIFDILSDPPVYEMWVVGNKRVHSYDKSWPEPGSEFHHKVGFGPLATKDKTVALEAEPLQRLVMLVRPFPSSRRRSRSPSWRRAPAPASRSTSALEETRGRSCGTPFWTSSPGCATQRRSVA